MDQKTRAIRRLYQEHFPTFVDLVFRILHPGSKLKWHWPIEVLAHHLQQCEEGKINRLIINMPPRYLKSMCASVAFPAWLLARHSEKNVMCISGHRGLAEDHHHWAKQVMMNEKYRSLFPHLRLSAGNKTIRLAQGGSRTAYTTSGTLTGRGADAIIIDDPLSATDVDADNVRERVNQWYDRNVYQRLNDKTNSLVIVVMQRLHVDDLTGHLLEQDGWTHLNLSAIATEDEWPSDFGLKGNEPFRRKGEALHPGLETRDQLRELMLTIGAKPFMAQYQQQPYPPGEGEGAHGALTVLPPDCIEPPEGGKLYFSIMPEYMILLEHVFGEPQRVRPGPPRRPWRDVWEWIEYYDLETYNIDEEEGPDR